MKSNKSFLGLFLAGLVLLPGCMLRVPSYRRQPLRIMREDMVYTDTQENIMVRAKLLTKTDKYDLFGEHIGDLEQNQIKVIYISVNNLNDYHYVLTPRAIGLNQMHYINIRKCMKHTSSGGRFATYIFGGMGAAGAFSAASIGFVAVETAKSATIAALITLSTAACTVGVGLKVISLIGLFRGIKSVVMNSRINKDLKEKMVHQKVIINSGDHYEGLIFVKASDYNEQFAVTVYEKDNAKKSVTFDVDLEQHENCA